MRRASHRGLAPRATPLYPYDPRSTEIPHNCQARIFRDFVKVESTRCATFVKGTKCATFVNAFLGESCQSTKCASFVNGRRKMRDFVNSPRFSVGGEAPYSGTAQKQLVPLRVRGLRPTKHPLGPNCRDHLFSGPRFRTQKSWQVSLRVRGLGRTTATPGKIDIHHNSDVTLFRIRV